MRPDKASAVSVDRVGDQIGPEDWARDRYFRTAFETNLVCNFTNMETLLDFTLARLGVGHDATLQHPIVMTEPPACLAYTRAHMNELLFETYQAPKAAFGIDALFSYAYNAAQPSQGLNADVGLAVSCSHEVSHLIPIYDGRPIMSSSFRMSYGGFHLLDHLYRSVCLQLPYEYQAAVFSSRCHEILQRFCYVSCDFQRELDDYCGRPDPSVVLALPPDLSHTQQKAILSEEEQRQRDERVHAQTEKLKELARERREAVFRSQRDALDVYARLRDDHAAGTLPDHQFKSRLQEEGFEDEEDFLRTLQTLQKRVETQRVKRGELDQSEAASSAQGDNERDLLEIPDDQLTEDERKKKRIQRMLKGSAQARQKKKEEKKKREEQQASEQAALAGQYAADPGGFVAGIRATLDTLQRRRQDRATASVTASAATTSGRRTGAANRQRAAVLTDMGTGTMEGSNFGADDNDWDVYRAVGPGEEQGAGGDSDGEDIEEIRRLRSILQTFAPDQVPVEVVADTSVARDAHPRIQLNAQRIRTPEILFQPSIIGNEEAGLAEATQLALQRVSSEQAVAMSRSLFVCGGVAWLPGFTDRYLAEMVMARPLHDHVQVVRALDPSLDAWRGAAFWARQSPAYGTREIRRHARA